MAEIKFEGIVKMSKGLKKRMDMSTVKTTVKLNGSEMQKKAQRKAPVDTSNLKNNIGLEISDGCLLYTSRCV